jgi:alkylation response protein AidB-like acyl-CoA dehydrogenase
MDARLTDEQQALRESAARVAGDLAPRSPAELPPAGPGEAEWAALGRVGLLGMRIPESAGGMPVSGVEVVLAAEELGRRLVPLPFIGSAVCATSLLAAAGASAGVLESLSAGRLRVAPALAPTLERLALRGEPAVAWDARGAEASLVVDRESRRLVAMRPCSARLDAVDLTRELRAVEAAAEAVDLGDLGGALPADAVDRVLALTLAALAADLVGVMQAALDLSVAHVSARVQFGVPVGTFQAVQHLAAEAAVSIEAARGLAWYAGWAVDELDAEEALLAARTAKAYSSEHAREVTETALQLHGGVGFTWEHMLHVLVRRALTGRQTLGDEHAHLEAIAARRSLAPA